MLYLIIRAPVWPMVAMLFVLDSLFGGLLLLRVGTATIVSSLGDTRTIGVLLITVAALQMAAVTWRQGWGILVLMAVNGWIYGTLAAASIRLIWTNQNTSTGGIATFTTVALMAAWVFLVVFVASLQKRPFR